MAAIARLFVCAAATMLVAAVGVERAAGLAFESFGRAGEHISRSYDWAKGVEGVLRHQSRVYWYDINGSEAAYYDGDVKTINELLELYSRIEMADHSVVIRAGRPSAKSLHDKLTPYIVEFNVASGISLHFLREYALTGLYPTAPRLIVHIDDSLVKKLGELTVPDNVTLRASNVRTADALTHADSADQNLRYRAITALGEAGDDSTAILDALRHAAADEVESIRKAGEAALEKLAEANSPEHKALQSRLAKFISEHPRHAPLPTPEEVLAAIRDVDAKYMQGFTVSGTRVEPEPTGAGKLVAWTITMGDGRLVVEQRHAEDADHPRAQGLVEYTIYSGPERMATIHGSRLWVGDELIESKPFVSFEPVGSTYNLLIGRVLWPLGRGYSRAIDHVSGVSEELNGLLRVHGESGEGGIARRWELLVDPAADFLVHEAKAFHKDEAEPSYVVETTGVLAGGGRSVVHTARWIEGTAGAAESIAVLTVIGDTKLDLIEATEKRLD